MLYLRAQVELEGFAGLQNYLRDVVKALEATRAPKIISVRSEINKDKMLVNKIYDLAPILEPILAKRAPKTALDLENVHIIYFYILANQTLVPSATLDQV